MKVFNVFMFLCLFAVCSALAEGKSALIYSESSKFKDAVVESLKAKLTEQGYSTEMLAIEIISAEKVTSSDLTFVIAAAQWGKPNKFAVDVIAKLDETQRAKIKFLNTTGGPGKNVKVDGVDAVSSASEMNKVDEVVAELLK